MKTETTITENNTVLATVRDNKLYNVVDGLDLDTLKRMVEMLSQTKPQTKPQVGQSYQGGIYIGCFEGKHLVVSADEAELPWKEAKQWCSDYSKDGYSDWYLPSKEELNFLFETKLDIGMTDWYWSSTERTSTLVWNQLFSGTYAGFQYTIYMTNQYAVRGFRVANV